MLCHLEYIKVDGQTEKNIIGLTEKGTRYLFCRILSTIVRISILWTTAVDNATTLSNYAVHYFYRPDKVLLLCRFDWGKHEGETLIMISFFFKSTFIYTF